MATSVRREVPEGFRIEGPVPDDGVENRRPCCFEAREAGRRAATLYTEAARRAMAVCGGGSTTGGRMYSFLAGEVSSATCGGSSTWPLTQALALSLLFSSSCKKPVDHHFSYICWSTVLIIKGVRESTLSVGKSRARDPTQNPGVPSGSNAGVIGGVVHLAAVLRVAHVRLRRAALGGEACGPAQRTGTARPPGAPRDEGASAPSARTVRAPASGVSP